MFGYTEKEVLSDNFDIMKIVAQGSRKLILERFKKSSKSTTKNSRYEMQGLTKSGEIIDLDVSVSQVKWKGESAYQGVYRNITEKKSSEIELKYKDSLLENLEKATYELLTKSDIEKAVNSAFDIIGKAFNISRIYIFENHDDPVKQEHFMTLKFEWVDGKTKRLKNVPRLQNASYKIFPGWYGQLSAGFVIKSHVRALDLAIKKILRPEGVLSILIVPIFVNRKFWGYIGFDECKKEREWSDAEISILQTAGNSFGNVIVRNLISQALAESEEKFRFLFDQAADLIAIINNNNTIINLNKRVDIETGWKRNDLIGENILTSNLLTENSKKILACYLNENIKEEVTPLFEVDLMRKDGRIVPYELNIVPIFKNKSLINFQAVFRNIKERKESEKSLRESEEKFRKIFENIQDVYFQANIHGQLTIISPSITRYSGYQPEEFMGKSFVNFYATPKERAKLLKEMQEKSEIIDFIARLRHKTNKKVYVSVNSHVIKDDKGDIVGIEGSLRDISEREVAYEEIRKLSRAVEQSPVVVMITDTSGKIVYVNPKFTEVTGYSFKEVVGKNPNILKSGEMSIDQYRELWDVISSGKEWKGELHNKKKNNELFWESASISPVKNEEGEITHYLAVKEDITEKKIQERKIDKYQNLLMEVSKAVQILISEKDFNTAVKNSLAALGAGSGADRVYIFENALTFENSDSLMNLKYEWNKDEIVSIAGSRFFNRRQTDEKLPSFYQTINEDKSFNALTKNLSKEEQVILKSNGILSMLIIPIYVDKQFWGFIGFDNCRNEEIWSESEESILRAAAASIGRAIEREKTNSELIRAKEEAEKAERLKSEFLAQVSHEIRSPLNVLLNYAQLIKELVSDKIEAEVFQGFDGMENAGNRIIRTIDLILNLSELQAGSYNFREKCLDIYSEVIYPLFQEYKKLAQRKNLIINIIRNTENTKVTADEYSIIQIFANLVDNAIKYSQEGKIEIVIDRNFNNRLFIKVSDTGIGISENYLPKMYTPFSQEEQGYTRSYEGNGLGLALVKKYCELNKADIFVDSIKGKGTTFTILLN